MTKWYQQGTWPLIGAIAVLVVTNGVALWKIYLQAQAGLKAQLRIKKIDYISQQLTEFYNPLYTLLHLNSEAFKSVGPETFPEDPIRKDVAGEVWSAIKDKVIIPNNHRMQEILRDKSHLISQDDSLEKYFSLQNHLGMYEVFQEIPTEVYSKFRFPVSILVHVETERIKLISQLNQLKEA